MGLRVTDAGHNSREDLHITSLCILPLIDASGASLMMGLPGENAFCINKAPSAPSSVLTLISLFSAVSVLLVEIVNHHALGLETKDSLDEAGPDRPGTTNDADLLALDLLRQPLLVRLDIRREHTDGAEGDVGGDEVGEGEHMEQRDYELVYYV